MKLQYLPIIQAGCAKARTLCQTLVNMIKLNRISQRDGFWYRTFVFLSALILIPVSLLPTIYGFGGYYIAGFSLLAGILFAWYAFKLLVKLDLESARKVMFCSFFYIPLVQMVLLFDFIGK